MNGAQAMPGDRDTPEILNAASVLLIDRAGGLPRLLMGRRQPGNVFLPDKWVFPGGRLEPEDALVRPTTPLHASDGDVLHARLAIEPAPVFAQSLALAAVRELFEETGHAIVLAAGARDGLEDLWPDFRTRALRPVLAPLQFLARAITPPGRPRRYDTRFFTADRRAAIEPQGPADGEFSETGWFTLDEARGLDIPVITRRILADLEMALEGPEPYAQPVPFYFQDGGVYRRDLLPRTGGPPAA